MTETPVEILVVEDNPGDVDLTLEALKEARLPSNVHVTRDGVEAMEFLHRMGDQAHAPRPDLVLLDLNMPRKDGREVLREMKEDPDLRRIPVVVLTTSEAEQDVRDAYDYRANAYIVKPVDFEQFFRTVRLLEDFWLTAVRLPSRWSPIVEPPSAPTRLLLIEDNAGDADLVRKHLLDLGEAAPRLELAQTLAQGLERLRRDEFGAVLLDLDLPDSGGLDTLDRMVAEAPSSPAIALTGPGGDDLGAAALTHGAADYLSKETLTGQRLMRSVRYSMERVRRQIVQARYRALVENSRDLVSILRRDLTVRYVSPSLEHVLGYTTEEGTGETGWLDLHPDDQSEVDRDLQRVLDDPDYTSRLRFRVQHRDGSWRVLDTIAQNCFDDRHIRGLVVNARDVTELRSAEEAALGTARRLERTLGALEDAVFTVEMVGRTIVSANPAAEAMFGYASDEMQGRSTRLLHVDDASYHRLGEESEMLLRQGEPFSGDFRMRRRDGTEFHADITVTLMDPVAGLEGGAVSVIRDLTERVGRERQVRFQAALLQQVGQPVLAVDEGGRVTYWNEAVEALTGLTREEVRGQPLIELLIAEEDGGTAAMAREIARSGGRWDGEIRLRRSDGGVAIIQATVTPGASPDGSSGGLIAVGVDVTELRRAEEESRQAAERIRLQADMLGAVGQAVIATDLDGRIIYWNAAAEALYGWTHQEALGKPVLEITPTDGEHDAMVEVFATLREGGTWTGELDLRRRDGSTFRGRVTDAPILDEDGRLMGIIGVSSDITEQKHLEEQLRQAQKMEAVGRLAGGIAHDFNNLLTAVEGHATILLDDLPADSPFREDVGQILKAGERAADLTRQLLAFSRRQVLEERNVDLNSVAVELERLLRRLVPERIRFRVAASGEPAVVRADPGQLHQVVMNLVVNAVDAIEEDGSITVAVEPVELDESETREIPWDVEPGPYVRLSVQDTGSGMPSEVMEHLFEPFFTTKREGHGTGLGLATVYGIIKQSCGHILVESEPGGGSTFRVFLPRVNGEADQVRERPTMVFPAEGGVVLLVEDDEAVRTITRRILVRAGYTVLEAASGREALDLAQGDIDLVISDVVMPDMGGPELEKRLGELYPSLKVILTSGYSESEVEGEVRQFGAAAFLPKPFTPQSLIHCVTAVLGGASPRPPRVAG